MNEVMIPLGAFAMIVAIVYLNVRKRERLKLIEMGINADIFETRKPYSPALKWGIILVALGLGLFLARLLINSGKFDQGEAYFSMLFLFGGAGLLIYHFIELKLKKNYPDKEEQ